MRKIFVVLILSGLGSGCYAQKICEIAAKPSSYINSIVSVLDHITETRDDSCALLILDSLTYFAIKNNDTVALNVLNQVCKKCSGKVYYHFDTIVNDLFYNNFPTFIKWASHHEDPDYGLDHRLITCLSINYAEATFKDLKDYLNKQKKHHKFTRDELAYMDDIVYWVEFIWSHTD